MAIPVISPATLEYFSIILGDAPLMVDGGSVTSTAANPTGLRLSGGNLFRDFTPWAEKEIDTWTNGFGHAYMGQNGYWLDELEPVELVTSNMEVVSTLFDDIRLGRAGEYDSVLPADKPDNVDWTTDPWVENKIIRTNDDRLFTFLGYNIYEYDPVAGDWDIGTPWLTTDSIHAVADADQDDYYIIDMCEFSNFLIVVTRPRFRKTGTHTGKFFLAQGGSAPQFMSVPNVFAVDLDSKFVHVVGGTSFFTAPLPNASTFAVGNPYYVATHYLRHILCATAVHQYGGYLFIGGSAGFAYTAGTTTLPEDWVLDGMSIVTGKPGVAVGQPIDLQVPYNVSMRYGGNNWVTGFAGIQGQTIGDFSVYMSTSKSLFLLDLAVPTHVKILDYSGVNVRNGKNMMTHNNDIYIPVAHGLFRFTQTGQMVPVGIDLVPENAIMHFPSTDNANLTQHMALASTPGTLISSTLFKDSDGTDDALGPGMALKGQGWHHLFQVSGSLHYEPSVLSVFTVLFPRRDEADWSAGSIRYPFVDNLTDNYLIPDATYYTSGSIHLGFFSADSPLLAKDWESISVYGRCFDEDNIVRVDYQLLDGPVTCDWEYDVDSVGDWVTAGTIDSGNDAEFMFPSANNCGDGRGSKWLAIRLTLEGDATKTPIVEGIKIKYFVPILDYFRFSLVTTLPRLCLQDGCMVDLPVYEQALWDEEIKNAVCSTEPVKFRNVDGVWYEVRVESASRRIEKVDYGASGRSWDVSWSLVLVQVNSATICGPDWEPPVCP
jgi:hypothetical protein